MKNSDRINLKIGDVVKMCVGDFNSRGIPFDHESKIVDLKNDNWHVTILTKDGKKIPVHSDYLDLVSKHIPRASTLAIKATIKTLEEFNKEYPKDFKQIIKHFS